MLEIHTRQKCYICNGTGVNPQSLENNCMTCNNSGYIEKWMSVAEFLDSFIKPEATI